MCWSTVRRRSIFSPSTRWRRRTRSWCRCNASSSRSKDCRNCCKTVDQVKETLNPGLTIHGIVLTMHDARNNLSNQVAADVRAHHRAQGLRHRHPAQCAGVGSAVLRQAGAGLRSQMRRQRSLSAARHRSDPAREGTARGLIAALADPDKWRTGVSNIEHAQPRLAKQERLTRTTEQRDSVTMPSGDNAMAEDGRSRLGRGLAALIGDVGEETKIVERARACAQGADRIHQAPIRATRGAISPTRSSTSWRPRSRSAASSSRSWCARSKARPTSSRSSPANGAGARRSAPACTRCRSSPSR